MADAPDILCIGSVLWDIIGRAPAHMAAGADVPGRIVRLPGGVALNIAMTVARFGLRPAALTAIGGDAAGADLVQAVARLGVDCTYAFRCDDLPTDCYMAIEAADGLVAAIADAHTLEQAGAGILAPLADGRLGSAQKPWTGAIALDGNLTAALLADIAGSPLFARADLRVAPASPGKAERLAPLLPMGNATLYVNLEEAGLLCRQRFTLARDAARTLLDRGAQRVLVTDGAGPAADGLAGADIIEARPRAVAVARVTGAGDTFMAAHLVAERRGATRGAALEQALDAAATHVSGDIRS